MQTQTDGLKTVLSLADPMTAEPNKQLNRIFLEARRTLSSVEQYVKEPAPLLEGAEWMAWARERVNYLCWQLDMRGDDLSLEACGMLRALAESSRKSNTM